jgi:hypothetical protein
MPPCPANTPRITKSIGGGSCFTRLTWTHPGSPTTRTRVWQSVSLGVQRRKDQKQEWRTDRSGSVSVECCPVGIGVLDTYGERAPNVRRMWGENDPNSIRRPAHTRVISKSVFRAQRNRGSFPTHSGNQTPDSFLTTGKYARG